MDKYIAINKQNIPKYFFKLFLVKITVSGNISGNSSLIGLFSVLDIQTKIHFKKIIYTKRYAKM
jgi:hypothetical protein